MSSKSKESRQARELQTLYPEVSYCALLNVIRRVGYTAVESGLKKLGPTEFFERVKSLKPIDSSGR